MTDISRRSFFRLVAGAAALVAVPTLAEKGYMLWGDGVHDDTEALQALIDGKPVSFGPLINATKAGWVDGIIVLPGGRYKLTDTIYLRESEGLNGVQFMSSRFEACHDKIVFHLSNVRNLELSEATFVMRNHPLYTLFDV